MKREKAFNRFQKLLEKAQKVMTIYLKVFLQAEKQKVKIYSAKDSTKWNLDLILRYSDKNFYLKIMIICIIYVIIKLVLNCIIRLKSQVLQ